MAMVVTDGTASEQAVIHGKEVTAFAFLVLWFYEIIKCLPLNLTSIKNFVFATCTLDIVLSSEFRKIRSLRLID